MCSTLFFIFNNIKIYLKAGDTLSEPFQSNVGGPQGDVSSALLFSLFISDIVNHIPKLGPKINEVIVSIILYADDMCLIAKSAEDLQQMLDALKAYCDANRLEVNVDKTKIMVFHRGMLPNTESSREYVYDGRSLEVVKTFCYLGFWLTVQLSFTRHLEATVAKARARIGLLFAKLPLTHVPLQLAIQVFQEYIAPIFHYGLPLWISRVSNSALQAMDAVWTKYLKRYLGLPAHANNATVFFVTKTEPLSKSLQLRAPHQTGGLLFPNKLSGMSLMFLANLPQYDCKVDPFNPIPDIPSAFWISRTFDSIPTTAYYRKRLMRELFDIEHMELCNNNVFHTRAESSCICKLCAQHAHPYHVRYCTAIYAS